jgi:hypothetical protein
LRPSQIEVLKMKPFEDPFYNEKYKSVEEE